MPTIAFGRTTRNTSRPSFIVDRTSVKRDTGRQIDWDLITEAYGYGAVPVQLNGAASAAAVAIVVDPITAPIPAYTTIRFGADEFARLTESAEVGETNLTVDPLVSALEDNDVGYADVDAYPGRKIPAGTVVDLLSSGMVVPSALGTGGGVTAYGILLTDAEEMSDSDAASGYGVAIMAAVYENLLPEATGGPPKVIDANWKTELLARGGAWMFLQYEDNTA